MRFELVVLWGLLGVAGCDRSRAELDRARQLLASVTAERDTLKGQQERMKVQVEALRRDLDNVARERAALVAATPPDPPPVAPRPGKAGQPRKPASQ